MDFQINSIINKSLLNILHNELLIIEEELNINFSESEIYQKEYGLIKLISRINNLVKNVIQIDINEQNTSLIITISRMIVDTYSVINLLLNHGSEKEQNLRYLLYLKDGCESKIKLTNDFISKTKYDALSFNDILIYYDKIINDIDKIIEEQFEGFYNKSINCNWKFNTLFPRNIKNWKEWSYSWSQLHGLTNIEEIFLKIYQNNYSEHVHGTGGLILKNDFDVSGAAVQGLLEIIVDISNILLNKYDTIINKSRLSDQFLDILKEEKSRSNKLTS